MSGGRALAAGLSLAAIALLLLSALQQESPLRPSPVALTRPLPAPIVRDEAHSEARSIAHHEVSPYSHAVASDKETNTIELNSETNSVVVQDDTQVSNGSKSSDKTVISSVPHVEDVKSDAKSEAKSEVKSDVKSEAKTDVKGASADNNTNVTSNKNETSGTVFTRAVYVAGHVWPAASLCPSLGRDLRVLILVTSAPSHTEHRRGVRLTWATYAARRDVALAFFIGLPPDNLTTALQEENQLYGDMIMGNFIDSYRNLTLKSISMLEWTFTYCPKAPRLLKTDDDMFINIPRLLQFVNNTSNHTNTIWGRVVHRWLPNRSPKSKYFLSRKQYPGKMLPPFATGPAYLVTRDATRLLYDATLARDATFLQLEDVAVTGVAARKAKIRLVNAAEFVNKHVRPSACKLHKLISVHMVSVELQLDLWRALHAKCKG